MVLADLARPVLDVMELSKAQQLAEVLKEKPDSDGHCFQAANELLRLDARCNGMLDALNRLCAWDDGEIGPHMDFPQCAAIAREAVKKFG